MTYAVNPYAKAAARADRPPEHAGPREIEAWALKTVCQRLKAGIHQRDRVALRDALILNQRLWTIFQADLMAEACPLPPGLRKNLLELSMFVDGETLERLADLDGEKVQVLIEINSNLAEGLQESPEAELATRAAATIRPEAPAPAVPMADAAPRPVMISV